MPEVGSIRIGASTGSITYGPTTSTLVTAQNPAAATAASSTIPPQASAPVKRIVGMNLGEGVGTFLSSAGTGVVQLNFATLVPGNGINLVANGSTIQISANTGLTPEVTTYVQNSIANLSTVGSFQALVSNSVSLVINSSVLGSQVNASVTAATSQFVNVDQATDLINSLIVSAIESGLLAGNTAVLPTSATFSHGYNSGLVAALGY